MGEVSGRKVEIHIRIKDRNRSQVMEEDEVRRFWKDYFEDLYNIDTQE